MAIDFSQVKSLTIPEGSVKQITDSQGNILWKEQSARTLVSIAVSGYTSSINRGTTWVFDGVVIATYDDSSTANVTSACTFQGPGAPAGTYACYAYYTEGGVSVTSPAFYITVNKTWSTLWSGSQKIGYGGDTSSEKLFTTRSYNSSLKLRITFNSMSTWVPSGDDSSTSFVPSNKTSPVTVSSFSANLTTLVSVYCSNTSRSKTYQAAILYDKTNGKIYGKTTNSGNSQYARASVVITKVEAYY